MTNWTDANFLQVLRREAREDPLVDLVVAEGHLVFFEAQAPQPDHDIHDGAPNQGCRTSSCGTQRVSRGGGQSGDGGIGLGTAGGAYAQNPYAIALWFWQKCHHVLDH